MIRRKINLIHHQDIPFNQKEIVFFSYRHIDVDACNAVIKHVKKIPNVAIWVDNQLSAGEFYDEEIQEVMQMSDSMLQVVTPHYFLEGSYTMDRELPFARQVQLPIIAVICETISEELSSYLQEQVDYVCSLREPNSIRSVFEKLHSQRESADIQQTFLHLTKRIDTWYLTPEDMYQLACGYSQLVASGKTSLIPKSLTGDKIRQYARCAAMAGITGGETLLQRLENQK